MNRTGKRQEESGNTWVTVTTALVKGGAAALAVTLLVLLLCSAAISSQLLSQGSMGRGVTAACVLGALAGGTAAARGRRSLALLLGLGTGCILFLLLLAGGVLFYERAPAPEPLMVVFPACLCGGALAGLLGGQGKKRRRSAKRG